MKATSQIEKSILNCMVVAIGIACFASPAFGGVELDQRCALGKSMKMRLKSNRAKPRVKLQRGAEVLVVGFEKRWARIDADGTIGYVKRGKLAKHCDPVDVPEPQAAAPRVATAPRAEAEVKEVRELEATLPTIVQTDSEPESEGIADDSRLFLGAGLALGVEIERPGLQLSAYYGLPVLRGLRVGGDLTLYLPRSDEVGATGYSTKASLMMFEINGNAQYVFLSGEVGKVYGLAGLILGIMRFSTETEILGHTESASDTHVEIGLNLGAGGEYDLGFANLFGEVKFELSGDFDQFVFAAGLRMAL